MKKKILIIGQELRNKYRKEFLELAGFDVIILDNLFQTFLTKKYLEQFHDIVIDLAPFEGVEHHEFLHNPELDYDGEYERWAKYGLYFILYIRQKLGFDKNRFKLHLYSDMSKDNLTEISEEYEFWIKGNIDHEAFIEALQK